MTGLRHPGWLVLGAWLLTSGAGAMTARAVLESLLPRLGEPDAPGKVLFEADFEGGTLGEWRPDPGWTLVEAPGGGHCARVELSGNDHEDLVLAKQVAITPGHPIAVCWRERTMEGAQPLYLRVDFFDASGVTGQPYATQEQGRTGPDWTDNVKLVTAWFPPYTRAITLHFHHPPDAKTTSLLDDVRVVDLQPGIEAALVAEREAVAQALDQLEAAAKGLPATGPAGFWKQTLSDRLPALRISLGACLTAVPDDPEAARVLDEVGSLVRRFTDAVRALQAGTLPTERLLVYATAPMSPTMVLPQTADLPGSLAERVQAVGFPGETEPLSLVLWPVEDTPDLLIEVSDLRGRAGTIAAAAVDVRWVKCWYQAGSAPHGIGQDRSRRVLVPELLLNDESLVRVDLDRQENALKLSFSDGARYVPIMDPKDVAWGWKASAEEFPVQDSPTLLPVDLRAGLNQQVWIRVAVPPNAKPGEYAGEVRLTAGGKLLGRLPLGLRVLPLKLPEPKTHYDPEEAFTYSLYYWGELDPEGRAWIGYKQKSAQQFRAELRHMWAHDIVAPAMIWSPDIVYRNEPLFREHLDIARETGMSGRPLYFADSGMIGNPTDAAALEALKQNVRRTIEIAAEYGFTGVYFYGLDEATGERLASQRTAWQAVQEAGGKVIVSGFRGQFEAVGDLLDLCNWAGPLDPAEPPKWHGRGHKVWNYANPQTPAEDPAVYRRNYGLLLWRTDYDGACTYCYMDSSGTPWNDFDCDAYRDHNVAYPTVDGIVETLALEGLREGAKDVKLATMLRQTVSAAKAAGRLPQKAAEAAEWLEALDPQTADLDAVRTGLIERILALREP